MARVPIKKITICGFGLIGGSMALDLLRGSRALEVVAYDRPKVLARLKKDKRFRLKVQPDFKKATAGADVIILAAMHNGNKAMLKRLASHKQVSDCLIIDTGAVKQPIVELAGKLNFKGGTQFLSTHPMAGREKSGYENAAANLFRGFVWYLDDDITLDKRNQSRLDWMVRKLAAKPTYIQSGLHDRLMSELSHLPQLISTVLGAQVEPKMIELAGPGLRSMLRLAGSPHSVWSEIIEENRDEIIDSLNAFVDNINLVKDKIQKKQSLAEIFRASARSYTCL